MTGWIIFGSVVLLLVLIFTRPVKVTAIYDANPEITVKILCFTIFRIPAPPKRKKKPKKQKKKKRTKQEKQAVTAQSEETKASGQEQEAVGEQTAPKAAEKGERAGEAKTAQKAQKAQKPQKAKLSMPEFDLEMIVDYVKSASPPVKRLFKKIKFRNLYIDWVVGSDDAAKTAIKYGAGCAAIYPLMEWLTTYFDVVPKEVNIEADFSAEKDDIFAYCNISLRISTALGCGLWLLFRMAKTYLKYNSKNSKNNIRKPAGAKGR
ncbi:MAG: DUF2953 domain-containing protein [Ruminiclostridium sp.]